MSEIVSIIIPNYNKGKYLKETIVSVLSQTYSEIEVIIVDDGSTDNSVEILQYYELLDSKLKVFYNPHLGKINAINFGISKAKGDLVKLWGSDDYMPTTVIKELVDEINSHDVIAHNCYITDEKLNIIKHEFIDMSEYTEESVSIKDIINGKGFPSGLYFFRRRVIELIFPLHNSISYEDWYIYMKLAVNNIKIKYINKSLGMYRQVPNSAYGGVNNESSKVYRYRSLRDIEMLKYFLNIVPIEFKQDVKQRTLMLNLSINGTIFDILFSDFSFSSKIKILLKRYFYTLYIQFSMLNKLNFRIRKKLRKLLY